MATLHETSTQESGEIEAVKPQAAVKAAFTVEDLERELSEEDPEENRENEALFAIIVSAIEDPDSFNVRVVRDIINGFELNELWDEAEAYFEAESEDEDEDEDNDVE
jgi:hypothetical protein